MQSANRTGFPVLVNIWANRLGHPPIRRRMKIEDRAEETLVPLEILHFPFMFLGCFPTLKSSQVPAFFGFGIGLTGIQAVFPGF
jgi:hypothetical protein